MNPALALIELNSVAKGILVTDAVAKKAPVDILETHPICPGKYLVLFAGDVGPVEESLKEGIARGSDSVVNDLFLPNLHSDVVPAITGCTHIEEYISIGVVETFSVASCVVAADIAAKTANVKLVEVRLANGLGGKAYLVMTGDLHSVEASVEAASKFVISEGALAGREIIAAPHPDLIEKGMYW